MTAPEVRRLSFAFDDTTPFQWNRSNPHFGFVCNGLSFIAPPFERYMVAATRMAMERIGDAETLAEADGFLRQEAQHARSHRHHVAALTDTYPGLRDISTEIEARFDALLAKRSLEFHLAYAADIEATFTPLFNVFLRHREQLFDNGDPNVAPLFMWHFVEEIEHRSSAQLIYDAAVTDRSYRLRLVPTVFRHIVGCFNVACRGFDLHVPPSERTGRAGDLVLDGSRIRDMTRFRGRSQRVEPRFPSPLATIPLKEKVVMTARLLRSQHPHHDAADEVTPPFAEEWIRAYDQGRDVVHWYEHAPSAGA